MVRINKAIRNILQFDKPGQIAQKLGVTEALISTWKNKDNDFTPRLAIAKKIYNEYCIEVYPFGTSALDGTWERKENDT